MVSQVYGSYHRPTTPTILVHWDRTYCSTEIRNKQKTPENSIILFTSGLAQSLSQGVLVSKAVDLELEHP